MNVLWKVTLLSAALVLPQSADRRAERSPIPPDTTETPDTTDDPGTTDDSGTTGTPDSHAGCGDSTLIDQLPFEIDSAGSYCVVDNLVGLDGAFGIEIDVACVEIDLHGHILLGAGGTVAIDAADMATVQVRNGVFDGWAAGVKAGAFSQISDVHFANMPGGDALELGAGAIVEQCSFSNVGTAVQAATNALLKDCFARDVTSGFVVEDYARVDSCSVLGAELGVSTGRFATLEGLRIAQVERGLELGQYSRVEGSSVGEFSQVGIQGAAGTWIGRTTVAGGSGIGIGLMGAHGAVEGCQVVAVEGTGLHLAGNESVALWNVLGGNTGIGLRVVGERNRVQGNSLDGNAVGLALEGVDNLVIDNHAAGNQGSDFDLMFPNTVGPTLSNRYWIQGSVPQANFMTPLF